MNRFKVVDNTNAVNGGHELVDISQTPRRTFAVGLSQWTAEGIAAQLNELETELSASAQRILRLERAVKEANERAWAYQSRPPGADQIEELKAELAKVCAMRSRTLESNRRLLEDNRELRARLKERAQMNLTQAITIRRLKGDPMPPVEQTVELRDVGGQLRAAVTAYPGRITRHLTLREDELFLEALRNAVGEQS